MSSSSPDSSLAFCFVRVVIFLNCHPLCLCRSLFFFSSSFVLLSFSFSLLLDNMQPWACLLLLLCQLSPPLHHQRASASCPAAVVADWPVCVVITVLWHGFSLLSRWLNNAVKLLTYNLGGSPEDNIIFYVAAFVGPHRVSLQSEDNSFIWKAYQTVFCGQHNAVSLFVCWEENVSPLWFSPSSASVGK